MRRASFSIGGVTSWTLGPTRITYTDQASELVAAVYRQRARVVIAEF
jgi:hypothetical protein